MYINLFFNNEIFISKPTFNKIKFQETKQQQYLHHVIYGHVFKKNTLIDARVEALIKGKADWNFDKIIKVFQKKYCYRRGFRGGRTRRTPPCSPLYVRPKNKFAPPVQSDNLYCLRPPVQHFLDPRLCYLLSFRFRKYADIAINR